MARQHHDFDVVLIAGENGDAAATAAFPFAGWLDLLGRRGLSVAVATPRQAPARGWPELVEAARLGRAALIEGDVAGPLWCRLAVAAGPAALHAGLGAWPRAGRLLVLAQRPFPEAGADLAVARAVAGRIASEQIWCPDSAHARAGLAKHGLGGMAHPQDWPSVLDPAFWRRERSAPAGRRAALGCVVGRGLGWPVAELAGSRRSGSGPPGEVVHRLHVEDGLLRRRAAALPPGWQVVPADAASPRRFLARLDFLAAHPEGRAPDSPPAPLLEAMATGRVVIPSPAFRPLLGGDLAYRPPEQVADTVRYLHAEPAFYDRYLAAQDRLLLPHAPDALWGRLEPYLSRPTARTRAAAMRATVPAGAPARPSAPGRRRVAFYPTNGVGLGHVTRLLAIARRLEPGLEPVFFTPCHALAVIEHAGYRTEYVSEPAYDETAPADHARAVAPSLARAFRYHDVRAVVFDGNVPREGLVLAAAERDLPFVWVRRGMWRADPTLAHFLELSRHADAVLEPEEAAAAADAGVTAAARDGAVRVPPILLLDRGEPLPRAEARSALGLPETGPCALVQLGSGNNRDAEGLLDHVLAAGERLGVTLLVAEWLISERPVRRRRVRYLSAFPNARYLDAFDFVVTAAGYNSFHELLHHGVPCIFLPNDDQRVDDQRARAAFADAQGAGICVPRGGEAQVGRYMEILLDAANRRLIGRRARTLCPTNGARAAAATIEHIVARNA